MEWNKKPCSYLKTLMRQTQDREQTQEVRLSEDMPDIGRVLCARGQGTVRNKQWNGDGISVSGGIGATVLYLPEDGSHVRQVEAWLPFQMKWSLPTAPREGQTRVDCRIKSLDARSLSARKLMVRTTVCVTAQVLVPAEARVCVPTEVVQDVALLTNVYPLMLPQEAGEKTLQAEQALHLDPGQRLLCWQVEPQITEQTVVGSRIVLRGNAQVQYLYTDEGGAPICRQEAIPFAQFADLEREYDKDAEAEVLLSLSAAEAEPLADGVQLRCGLMAQYLIRERIPLEVTEDAYSPLRPVELSVEELVLPTELDRRSERVLAECAFDGGKPIAVSFLPEAPAVFREGQEVHLTLAGTFHILYEDEGQTLQAATESWSRELCYPVAENARLWARIDTVELAPSGLSAELAVTVQTDAEQNIPMITGLEAGQMRPTDKDRPTLILRRMDDGTLWEMAKKSGSTVEAISKANGLTAPPERGQMLLIPVS